MLTGQSGLIVALALSAAVGCAQQPVLAGNGQQLEGELAAFMGRPEMRIQQVFEGQRFPNVIVGTDGSIVAAWGHQSVSIRRSTDGGLTWDEPVLLGDGIHGGGALVNERNGDMFVFVEGGHPPAPLTVYRSGDHGRSWATHEVTILPDSNGNVPAMHMNERGITLRHGEHAGRLLRATRWYAGGNDRSEWGNHYTNAMYSDDGGVTWQTSEPFPENGTGEATLVELSDGTIYYNSRVHWAERPQNTRRRSAISNDGGHTWKDWQLVEVLPDGRQDNSYGLMAGLVRLPVQGQDILIFSNIDTDRSVRERITVWASFDGGKTWPVKRLVYAGPSAYSSLAAGRPGTPSEGWIYLFYEGGEERTYEGGFMARFNLAWLLDGKPLSDFLSQE